MADKLTITLNGEETELFMSYGLLMKLANMTRDCESFLEITANPEMMERVLTEILKRRRSSGVQAEPFSLDDCDISMEDASKVAEWAAEHVIDFFMKQLDSANRVMDAQTKLLEKMMEMNSTASSDGTKD